MEIPGGGGGGGGPQMTLWKGKSNSIVCVLYPVHNAYSVVRVLYPSLYFIPSP